jgi:hypothetical protein
MLFKNASARKIVLLMKDLVDIPHKIVLFMQAVASFVKTASAALI